MADHDKLAIMATHGPASPEMATIPFVMAGAALASEVKVVIGLQGDGVCLAHRGEAEPVTAPGFPPLAKLMTDFRELGGTLLVCGPCANSRGIADALVDGAEVVAAGRFVAEITSARASLSY
jgi:predicted peroxiredoxin